MRSQGSKPAASPIPAALIARGYFATQAAAGILWWVSVFTLDPVREATLGGLNPVIVAALDIPLFAIASALVAAGLRFAVWVAVPWTALVAAGMVTYATLTGEAGWGALLMVAATGGSAAAGLLLLTGRIPTELVLFGPFRFRLARRSAPIGYLGRTGSQIILFWGLFLVAIPLIVSLLERRWQLHLDVPAAVRVGGAVILLAASTLGIWSAVTMSRLGEGTPLPSAMPRHLVIAGPYRFVRNPMAVAGIGQGVAVGLIMGSWLVVLYALCGSLVWNWVIRPLEEADLQARFGQEFADYRARVSCWIPRLSRPAQSSERAST